MSNIYFIVIVSLLTLCISFVSTKGTLSNLKYTKRWWKIITVRGQILILLTVSIITLLIWQHILNERTDKARNAELKRERDQRDSTITSGISKGVDSNRKILFNDLSEALAKQNLRLDTVTRKLEYLKDSVGRTVVIKNEKRPTFELCPEGPLFVSKEYPKLIIPYCAFDDWIRINNVTTYIILIDTLNNLHLLEKDKAPISNFELSPTKAVTKDVNLSNIKLDVIKGFYIYVTGDYLARDKLVKYPVDVAYYYGFRTKIFSYLVGQLRQNMINFLKDQKQL